MNSSSPFDDHGPATVKRADGTWAGTVGGWGYETLERVEPTTAATDLPADGSGSIY